MGVPIRHSRRSALGRASAVGAAAILAQLFGQLPRALADPSPPTIPFGFGVGPHIIGVGIADIDGAKAQLSAATGVQWLPELRATVTMLKANGQTQTVNARVNWSAGAAPIFALEQTDPEIYPYNPTETHSPVRFAYVVEDVATASAQLTAAGMSRILTMSVRPNQTEAAQFAIHEGIGGLLVEVLDASIFTSTPIGIG